MVTVALSFASIGVILSFIMILMNIADDEPTWTIVGFLLLGLNLFLIFANIHTSEKENLVQQQVQPPPQVIIILRGETLNDAP